MHRHLLFAALFLAVPVLLALALFPARAADAARGADLFAAQCAPCHALSRGEGEDGVGPSLHGLFGRRAGGVDGFSYSRAMEESQAVWTAESLDAYLAAPHDAMPGNRMPFGGLDSADKRADLIAHLRQATQ